MRPLKGSILILQKCAWLDGIKWTVRSTFLWWKAPKNPHWCGTEITAVSPVGVRGFNFPRSPLTWWRRAEFRIKEDGGGFWCAMPLIRQRKAKGTWIYSHFIASSGCMELIRSDNLDLSHKGEIVKKKNHVMSPFRSWFLPPKIISFKIFRLTSNWSHFSDRVIAGMSYITCRDNMNIKCLRATDECVPALNPPLPGTRWKHFNNNFDIFGGSLSRTPSNTTRSVPFISEFREHALCVSRDLFHQLVSFFFFAM